MVDFLDGINKQEHAPGNIRVQGYIGSHACKVVYQKMDRTDRTKIPRYNLGLEVIKSTGGIAPGMKVTYSFVQTPKSYEVFFKELRRVLGVLYKLDPASEQDWAGLATKGEGSAHAGKLVLVHVTPGKDPKNNRVNIEAGPEK